MAFYADVYGYIEINKGENISCDLVKRISETTPIFKPGLSHSIEGKASSYVSFACSVKLDEGEDVVWLAPFEELLGQIEFRSATVNIVHEESDSIMMYSYTLNRNIQKVSSRLIESFIDT